MDLPFKLRYICIYIYIYTKKHRDFSAWMKDGVSYLHKAEERGNDMYQPKIRSRVIINRQRHISFLVSGTLGEKEGVTEVDRAVVVPQWIDPAASSKCYQTICNLADRQGPRPTVREVASYIARFVERSRRGSCILHINMPKSCLWTVPHSLHSRAQFLGTH